MRDEFDCPPLGSGWLREGGVTVGVFLVMSTAWQRVATGGGFPGDVHRLAAGGYGSGWLRVAVFLVMSTAWQRVATGGRVVTGG
jgi:hypothetical protein